MTAIHEPRAVADHLPELPLCWVAEGEQRGATVEEWEVTFDQVLDDEPGDSVLSYRCGERAAVTCGDCLAWLHA